MKKSSLKALALILSVLLCCGCLPHAAIAAEESNQEYQYVSTEYYSKVSNAYVGDSAYYSDEWFLSDPSVKNDRLALLSAQFAISAAEGQGGEAFLKALGFSDVKACRYDSKDPLDCAYVCGKKSVEDKTILAVVFQGDLYADKGWQQNVTVNLGEEDAGDQASYAAAADAFLQDLDEMKLQDGTVFWIVGMSRAGAVANLTAARLLEKEKHPALICYTFESPATTENPDAHSAKYESIHNYLCDDDPVTMLPIWGMTRYGNEIIYNTASIEEVIEAAAELNPDTREFNKEYPEEFLDGGLKEFLDRIVGKLEESAPSRADYAKPRTISISTEAPFVYTYQGALQALCHVVFGSSGGIDTLIDAMADSLDSLLAGLTYARVEEAYADQLGATDKAAQVRADSESRFLELAETLYDALKEAEPSVDVKLSDVYGLLKLLAPQLVNVDAVSEKDWTLPEYEDLDFYEYFDYMIMDSIMGNPSAIVFSHHPDMVLARLKLLAPAPKADDVNLAITAPKAGQDVTLAPKEAKNSADALGYTWLSVTEAKWETKDTSLSDNRIYYFTASLRFIGHTVPDSFRFTINGEEAKKTEFLRQNGEVLVTGTWEYTMGKPEPVNVRFDTGSVCQAPDMIQVGKGARLGYTSLSMPSLGVIEDDTVCWRWSFDGWTDLDGGSWEDVDASSDVMLHAKWTRLIDKVEVIYETPRLGEGGKDLFRLRAPEGVPYELKEFSLYYNDEEENLYLSYFYDPDEEDFILDQEGKWDLGFKVYANEPDVNFCFETVIKVVVFEEEEFYLDLEEFTGVLTVNGEKVSHVSYSEGDYNADDEETIPAYLNVDYTFIPDGKEKPQ